MEARIMSTERIIPPAEITNPNAKGPYQYPGVIEVVPDIVDEIVSSGMMTCGYWAEAMVRADDGIVVAWFEEEGNPDTLQSKAVTWQDLARGITEIAFGKGARRDLVDHARRAILEDDAGEVDGEIADVAIQYALFDEIVYG